VLDVKDIHVYLGSSYVLQGVSLQVPRGQVVSLLGRNGVGKTTLVRSIMGLARVRYGTMTLDGVDITSLPANRRARLGVGLVPQGRLVFPSLTTLENLQVAVRGLREHNESPWTIERFLDAFPNVGERLPQSAGKLSGGEQQLLAIGRALMGNPHLLLMDEPSEGLAPLITQEIGQLIRQLASEGMAVLLVEQNFAFAVQTADHVLVMSKGNMVYESSPEVLRKDLSAQKELLGV
jgi:branched-chain amino acid transport system ATP-binding protein